MQLDFIGERLTRDYLVFVYLLCLGALQVAATLSHLRGLAILSSPWGVPIGLVISAAGIAWFFWSEDRNTIGLAGWEQFLLFVVGATGALVSSLLACSLLWPARPAGERPEEDGVDALRRMSYWEALASRRTR